DNARKRCTRKPSRPSWPDGETCNGRGQARCAMAPPKNPYNRGSSYAGKMSAILREPVMRARSRQWRFAILTQERRRLAAHWKGTEFSSRKSLAFSTNFIETID